jgi:cell division protein FtsQ
MKINWLIIGNIFISGLALGLVAFTNQRFERQETQGIRVHFTGPTTQYVTDSMVNKLLIQKNAPSLSFVISEVDLNTLEKRVKANPFVQDANVYITVDKQIEVVVEQKTPLARVVNGSPFYLDNRGGIMPLSDLHSARVPLVKGSIEGEAAETIVQMLDWIQKDKVLEKSIVAIEYLKNGKFELSTRLYDYKIEMGDATNMQKKMMNLKSFMVYADKHALHEIYEKINLQYPNQLVCTKKSENGI